MLLDLGKLVDLWPVPDCHHLALVHEVLQTGQAADFVLGFIHTYKLDRNWSYIRVFFFS